MKALRCLLNKDECLLKHGVLVLLGTTASMILGYFFQVFAGRLLGPSDYGIFGSLAAILYIVSVIGGAITTSITKFASEFNARKEMGKLKGMLVSYSLKSAALGAVIAAIFLPLSAGLANALRIEDPFLIVILAVIFPFSFVSAVLGGMLNGLQRFEQLSATQVLNSLVKLLFGIGLVLLGFGVLGAILGLVFASIATLSASLFFLRCLFKEKSESVSGVKIVSYSIPVLASTALLAIMVNADIILVKHFFPSRDAGFYVAASTLTKVILWASGALLIAMFPKVSDMNAKNSSPAKLLRSTLCYILLLSFLTVALLFLAPKWVTVLVFGERFEEASALMLPFAAAISLYSLSNAFIRYDLAVARFSFLYPLCLASACEIALIALFHSSLLQVIHVLIAINALLLASLAYINRHELIARGEHHG